jgi:hypothetical protein
LCPVPTDFAWTPDHSEVFKEPPRPRGILQQWFPGGDDKAQEAVERSLREAFPYVVAFKTILPVRDGRILVVKP